MLQREPSGEGWPFVLAFRPQTYASYAPIPGSRAISTLMSLIFHAQIETRRVLKLLQSCQASNNGTTASWLGKKPRRSLRNQITFEFLLQLLLLGLLPLVLLLGHFGRRQRSRHGCRRRGGAVSVLGGTQRRPACGAPRRRLLNRTRAAQARSAVARIALILRLLCVRVADLAGDAQDVDAVWSRSYTSS